MTELDYGLPDRCIAQVPCEPRDAARLLVAVRDGEHDSVRHRHIRDLPTLIRPGDVIVVNETKVLPARLRLRKASGGSVEVLLLERREDGTWSALVRPSKRVAEGTRLVPDGAVVSGIQRHRDREFDLEVEVGGHLSEGRRVVRLNTNGDELEVLDVYGAMPLPPYITAPLADPARYQTVFARLPGSVAAPTAGLHLTPTLLDACVRAGAALHAVELVVGLDTFRPVTVEHPEDHTIHTEAYNVPESTWQACRTARDAGARVIAVGTTSVRALESAAATGRLSGRTSLFIHGSYPFRLVNLLLTNFHMPRSTLLLLLDAFTGPRWRDLYTEAMAQGYRFLSFGDAMLVDRRRPPQ